VPRADPEKSFEVAVRHLFRHLADAEALRKNPLVSFAFRVPHDKNDRAALSLIRSRLLDAGRLCYAEDLKAGLKTQAEMQSAIVTALLTQRSTTEIASELSISARQFYRYRRDVCTRLGRMLAIFQVPPRDPAHVNDLFFLLLQRAALLVDGGFAAKAVAELERSVGQASSNAARVETLLELSKAELELGEIERADGFVKAARRLMHMNAEVTSESRASRSRLRLAEFRVARTRGDDRAADAAMDYLIGKWNAEGARAMPSEFDIEILVELCRLRSYEGRRPDAREAIVRAAEMEERMRNLAPRYRAQIACEMAILSEDGLNKPDDRYVQFAEALNLSLAIGSALSALCATVGLTHHYANLKNDDLAKAHAVRALRIARTIEGNACLVNTTVDIANALLRTRHWRVVEPLLEDAKSYIRPGSVEWLGITLFHGVVLTRNKQYSEALDTLKNAETAAQTGNGKSWLATVFREKALLLYAMRRINEARNCARSAVDLAEVSASAPNLCSTYRAAGIILSDESLLLLADNLVSSICGAAATK
jgi:tetratricopeptide (TPR) repeat protein